MTSMHRIWILYKTLEMLEAVVIQEHILPMIRTISMYGTI